ncbi:MAG: hypothetical protein HGA67_00210 [Candidatus Yonathbacteria bacterium]|nr:hypothetical protein [Candidatus Yonathbacteria bacterium]
MRLFYKKSFHGFPASAFFIKKDGTLIELGNFSDMRIFRDFRSGALHVLDMMKGVDYVSAALYIGGEVDTLYYQHEKYREEILDFLKLYRISGEPLQVTLVDDWDSVVNELQGFLLTYHGEPLVAYGYPDGILDGLTSFSANPDNHTHVLPDIFSAFRYLHREKLSNGNTWHGGFVYHGLTDILFVENDAVLGKTLSFLTTRILHKKPRRIIPVESWEAIPCF